MSNGAEIGHKLRNDREAVADDEGITSTGITANKLKAKSDRKEVPPPPGVRQNYVLNKFERKNDALFDFYRKQGVIPEAEWEQFKAILGTELPASFRIQRSLSERDALASYLEQRFIAQIARIEAEEGPACGIHPPQPIAFVPYAYQTKMTRTAIRQHPILKQFHQFLIDETELGNISRQEACSMVPPLLLDVQPHHRVLDACAAPGSKTMQIIELMHESCPNPTGLIVANDNDYKRCYLLVRQTLKRMPTANVAVVSHDAAQLPAILDAQGRTQLFDRVLCDVICSGDGTLRKNPELWNSWDPMKGVNLHKLQLQIARRCVELLAEDGLMTYSTCSLNPLEDEAVVAQLLRTFEGKLELVDVSDRLPELKRASGVSKWKVFDKKTDEIESVEALSEDARRYFKRSMFPPTPAEAHQMHLERAFRILPHSQDSGGFFVAVLLKTRSSDVQILGQETGNSEAGDKLFRRPAKRARFTNKEEPFTFLADNDKDWGQFVDELNTHFGIPRGGDQFPHANWLVRSRNTERKKEIYFVNDATRQFLKHNGGRFRIVNAGVGLLRKIVNGKVPGCPYRLKQDGLRVLTPHITKRVVDIPPGVLIKILKGRKKGGREKEEKEEGEGEGGGGTEEKAEGGNPQYLSLAELDDDRALFEDISSGSVLLRLRSNRLEKELCAWRGPNSISAFVAREEKKHILRLMGEEEEEEREGDGGKEGEETTRREKGRRAKQQEQEEQRKKDEAGDGGRGGGGGRGS